MENRAAISSTKRYKSKGSAKDNDKPTLTSKRARYILEDNTKIRQLKEQGLS